MGLRGAVLGDIAGSYYEFKKKRDDWQTCELFRKESVYTDDTVQSIAVKIALTRGRDIGEVLRDFCKTYEFVGFGGNMHKWLEHPENAFTGSYANGSAMRVSFIGEYCKTLEECEKTAELSARCTHNSEEGIKGAVTVAGCVFLAGHGASKEEILQYAYRHYPKEAYEYSVSRRLSEYRDDYEFHVECQKSVPVAIRCFYESSDFISCLRNVIYVNGDTDTLGAMAGGIAQEFYGETIPNEDEVMDACLDGTLKKWLYQ